MSPEENKKSEIEVQQVQEAQETNEVSTPKVKISMWAITLRDFIWHDNFEVLRRLREIIVAAAAIATAIGAWLAYESLKETGKSVETGIATAVYVNNNDQTKVLLQYPDLMEYFDKDGRDASVTDEQLLARFESLPQDKKNIVTMICTINADTAELTFIQRKVIPPCDWNGWWRYYCDLYDESPVLRKYLERRSVWYTIDNAIVPENRNIYFKKLDDSKEACIEGKINDFTTPHRTSIAPERAPRVVSVSTNASARAR